MTSRVASRLAARVLRSPSFLEDATLINRSPGTRNEYGEYVPGVTVTTNIRVATAPLTGQERLVLPEGLRDDDVRKFWLRGQVTAVQEGVDAHEGDQIGYDGNAWQIFQVNDWGAFREAMAMRTQEVAGPAVDAGAFSRAFGVSFDRIGA